MRCLIYKTAEEERPWLESLFKVLRLEVKSTTGIGDKISIVLEIVFGFC